MEVGVMDMMVSGKRGSACERMPLICCGVL